MSCCLALIQCQLIVTGCVRMSPLSRGLLCILWFKCKGPNWQQIEAYIRLFIQALKRLCCKCAYSEACVCVQKWLKHGLKPQRDSEVNFLNMLFSTVCVYLESDMPEKAGLLFLQSAFKNVSILSTKLTKNIMTVGSGHFWAISCSYNCNSWRIKVILRELFKL